MITGIIAEFNPFHNGHKYLIDKAKENGDTVICVMSGNFVQRGDIAVYDKFTRTYHALSCGADMVIHLPCQWSMSCAENFALGGVSLLKSTGMVDRIVFGSENCSASQLKEIAKLRNSENFKEKLKQNLETGNTYPVAFEAVLNEINPKYGNIASTPNNILGIEYIDAAEKLNFNVKFSAVNRIGTAHDSNASCENFMSASAIREKIRNGNVENIKNFVPKTVFEDINNKEHSSISNLDKALLFSLKSKPKEYFYNLPDVNEGIENRIYEKIKTAESFEDLIKIVSTKRYTSAHIRRLLLSAAFGIDNTAFKKYPPYMKILGYTDVGKSLIGKVKEKSNIPVILSSADYLNLTGFAKQVFITDKSANDLYGMSFDTPVNSSADLTHSVIKI